MPGSFRIGPPGGKKRRPPPRPLQEVVDEWLAVGGWYGDKDTAGSVEMAEPDSKAARESMRHYWRKELRLRGWTGRWLHRQWEPETIGAGGGEPARMYWWALLDKAPAEPPSDESLPDDEI